MCFIIRTLFYNEPLTLRELSRLARCSLSKTSRTIETLKRKKLVNVNVKGRAYLLETNVENPLLKYSLLKEEAHYTGITFERYPWLRDAVRKCKGDVVIVFGSYAAHEAAETSDVDTLTINGSGGDFNLSYEEFRKMMVRRNNTLMSILKKHVIVSGFEIFVDEVIKWKKEIKLYGASP